MEKPETDKNVENNPKISHENKDIRKNLLEIAGYGGISATANIINYKVGDLIRTAVPAEGVLCNRQASWGVGSLDRCIHARPEPDSTVSPPLIHLNKNNHNSNIISSKSMNAIVDATSLKCYNISYTSCAARSRCSLQSCSLKKGAIELRVELVGKA